MRDSKSERTRRLRDKRPALESLGYDAMLSELYDIIEACADVKYFTENDCDTLMNALDGDEEAEYEFRMAFSDLDAKADRLYDALRERVICEDFDDCTVGLIGNRYTVVGFDFIEEDYFTLTSYDQELAATESGKKLMRHTKAEMVSIIGQCLGITISFLDLRQSYDYLKATFDILRDENTSLLKLISDIDAAYEQANEVGFYPWYEECKKFDRLLDSLPDLTWLA